MWVERTAFDLVMPRESAPRSARQGATTPTFPQGWRRQRTTSVLDNSWLTHFCAKNCLCFNASSWLKPKYEFKWKRATIQVCCIGGMFTSTLYTTHQHTSQLEEHCPPLQSFIRRSRQVKLACLCIWMRVCVCISCVPNSGVWRTPGNYCLPLFSPQETHFLGNRASDVDCVWGALLWEQGCLGKTPVVY